MRRTRRTRPALVAAAAFFLAAIPASAQPACKRTDFEAVVGEAGAALRDLNQKNRPGFQDKLRRLRDKRGWSHDEFMAEAAPFVQDETIADYDQRSSDYLARINSLGSDTSRGVPDCRLLAELKDNMRQLVAAQTEKWAYMFSKIDAALGP